MKQQVQLFISQESATYHYVKSQVESYCRETYGESGFELTVIDVINRPDLAEKHNIEALPTTICDGKRFIGIPRLDGLMSLAGGQAGKKK